MLKFATLLQIACAGCSAMVTKTPYLNVVPAPTLEKPGYQGYRGRQDRRTFFAIETFQAFLLACRAQDDASGSMDRISPAVCR
jgi:hypothetical protein